MSTPSDRRHHAGTRVVLDLAPVAAAAPAARARLTALLTDSRLQHRLGDGALALSELVTNAVLHGRAPITVELVLSADVLRASVHDTSPVSPAFSMLDPIAVTGRGLLLVSGCTDAWGVEPQAGGKTVWFELHRVPRDAHLDHDVEQLLASWGDDLVTDPAQECVRVVVTDLDTALLGAGEAHVEGVLRELALLLGPQGSPEGLPPGLLRHGQAVLGAAAALEALRTEVKAQTSGALLRGAATLDLTLTLRRQDAELVRDLLHALDEADRMSRRGLLLSVPVPDAVSEFRRRWLTRVLDGLRS